MCELRECYVCGGISEGGCPKLACRKILMLMAFDIIEACREFDKVIDPMSDEGQLLMEVWHRARKRYGFSGSESEWVN